MQFGKDLWYQATALDALQELAEAFLTGCFEGKPMSF